LRSPYSLRSDLRHPSSRLVGRGGVSEGGGGGLPKQREKERKKEKAKERSATNHNHFFLCRVPRSEGSTRLRDETG